MASFNKVILAGNLTRDVELRYTPSGKAVTDIGVAMNERVKSGDKWITKPLFVDVTLWGRTAEVAAEYLTKGSAVLIEGRLQKDEWEQDGKKRQKLRVVASSMSMLGGSRKNANDQAGGGENQTQEPVGVQSGSATVGDDEIPF